MPEKQDTMFADMARTFKISSARRNPGIYISDFYVLRSLESPGTHIQRHVELKRGLNILWANPNPPEKQNVKGKRKIAGHTAGKSTFCRLIRYSLGENSFGSETVEQKIVQKFLPHGGGWIVLRVEVEGTPWIVGRSFADKQAKFGIQNGVLADFIKNGITAQTGYDEFLKVIEENFVKPLGRSTFPGHKGDIHWSHLLPWFTRDQEARLLSITTWRALVGKSNAPATDTDERHFLMRLVLGLLSPGEASELDNNEKLNEKKRALDDELPKLNAKVEQAFGQLSEWVEIEAKGLEHELSLDAATEMSKTKAADVEEKKKNIPTAEAINKALENWRKTTREAASAAESLKSARQRIKDLEKQLADCDADKIEQKAKIEDLQRQPPASVCGVPIGDACEKGKLFHQQHPTKKTIEEILGVIESRRAGINEDLTIASNEVSGFEQILRSANDAETKAGKEYELLEAQKRQALEVYHEANAEQKIRARLIDSTGATLSTYLKKKGKFDETAKDIRDSIKEQDKHRQSSTNDRRDFSGIYERVLQYMLGDDVTGAVEADGRKLDLSAEGRNDLDSGAITAAKLISFDIAAMVWSMEGRGSHPRFLIHDSPREADMASDIYEGLFEAAKALETLFSDKSECNFQYIVTTTATPPDDLKQTPWLLDPILNALVPEQRILGLDL